MTGTAWIRLGALSAALAVAAGAFGAHALRERLSEPMLAVFETGARYQMYHALALVAVGLLAMVRGIPSRALAVAGWSFLVGTILFAGSLYALALTGERRLGAITPLGGLAFLVGWVALGISASGGTGGKPRGDV